MLNIESLLKERDEEKIKEVENRARRIIDSIFQCQEIIRASNDKIIELKKQLKDLELPATCKLDL